ncbi:KAT8 regulatory NSL complex subunit 2-like isoform X2 [Apostichopus japonicus]|uniref:KAT8 regulatory NSL complex subunit 2-like isoform X2 n=1 Tax=Stichopus japonicus TaxID=307972 RepID=UPI003AB5DF83
MSKPYRQRSSAVLRKSQHGKSQLDGSFCRYAHRICMQDRLDGFDFCIDHILQDKNAPFKPCNFVSAKSGAKCTKAAPRGDKKDGYCKQHTRRASVLRYKASLKSKPKDPAQLVLDELDYYAAGSTKGFPSGPVSSISKTFDYGSGSDSDIEPPQLDQTYQCDQDSDAESVDSEPEDLLKYAEVYTAEEVALITRDKLIRLQSLYINQFKRLQYLMKEKRREYLSGLRKEIPLYGPNLGRMSDTKEKKRLRKLKAMMSYRKRKGLCALLHRKSKNRRIQVTHDYDGPVKETKLPVCSFSEGEEKCDRPCVPLVKFCMDHVFLDPRQVLYKRCSKASGVCQRAAIPYYKGFTCKLHHEVPPYTSRLWKPTRLQKRREPAPVPLSLFNESSILSSLEPMDTTEPIPFNLPNLLSLPSTSKTTAAMSVSRQGSAQVRQEHTSVPSGADKDNQSNKSQETVAAVPPEAGTASGQAPNEPTPKYSTDTPPGLVASGMPANQLSSKTTEEKPSNPKLTSHGQEEKQVCKDGKDTTEETEAVIDVTGISQEPTADGTALDVQT